MKYHFLAPILMKLGRNVARKVSKHLYVPICILEVPGGHIEFFSIFVQNIKFHFLAPILMKLGRNVARKVSKHLYVPICSLEVPGGHIEFFSILGQKRNFLVFQQK